MRKSLQERGKWKHPVPAQEEGEPEPKHARWYERTNAGLDLGAPVEASPTQSPAVRSDAGEGTADTPDSLPPLEDSPTAEGTPWPVLAFLSLPGLNLNLH